MENKQIKLLTSLARDIRAEKKVKAKVVISLQSAKILTKQGDFTSNYSHLRRVVSSSVK